MPSFGPRSLANLETCDERLRTVASEVIRFYDFSVIEGHRSIRRQQALFAEGRTKIDGISQRGKHNYDPSQAYDLLPYPSELNGVNIWIDRPRFYLFMGLVNGIALSNGIELRFGCDWNGDGSISDQSFHDLPHVEIK